MLHSYRYFLGIFFFILRFVVPFIAFARVYMHIQCIDVDENVCHFHFILLLLFFRCQLLDSYYISFTWHLVWDFITGFSSITIYHIRRFKATSQSFSFMLETFKSFYCCLIEKNKSYFFSLFAGKCLGSWGIWHWK